MNLVKPLLAALLLALAASAAQARPHHYYAHPRHLDAPPMRFGVDVAAIPAYPMNEPRTVSRPSGHYSAPDRVRYAARGGYSGYTDRGVVGGRPAGCPYAFCGCGTSLHIFGRIIPELNLASNWRRFPPASCAPGNVAWSWGHVFAIESCNGDGTAVAYDSNSGGHLTRIHTVSLSGYHVVNPQGGQWASAR